MKILKKIKLLIILSSCLFFSNCAYNIANYNNLRSNETHVVLSKNNFEVVNSVKGEAENVYIFGLGGTKIDGLISEARSKMYSRAKMKGTSRAIINETIEIKESYLFIMTKYKVIVSGQVVEFFDE